MCARGSNPAAPGLLGELLSTYARRGLLGAPSTHPLGVMRRKTLAFVVVALSVTAGAAFVFVPPFPEPSALISSDYAALQARLGPPTVVFGDKFVGWSRPRFVATWTLEAGMEFPLRPGSRSAEIHRCLWIQWAGYATLCRRSYATPVQSGQVSGHDS